MMPQWYDVKYAYSGLHSIINPPPPNVELFEEKLDIGAIVAARIKSTTLNNESLGQKTIECEFCFKNYSKLVCQFYRSLKPDFKVMRFRNGNPVCCECCDFTEDEEEEEEDEEEVAAEMSDSNSTQDKRAKNQEKLGQNGNTNGEETTNEPNEEPTPTKIQPGWYGKGWKTKTHRRRRRRNT